jgi:hypothetical protein
MIGLLFKLCIVVTPSNIISKIKHYKGIVIAIISLLTYVKHHRLIVE